MVTRPSLAVLIVLALVLPAAVMAQTTPWHKLHTYSFVDYESEFRRAYSPEERALRQPIFEAKLQSIIAHNSADPPPSYYRGVNHMSDRFPHELRTSRGLDRSMLYNHRRNPSPSFTHIDTIDLPETMDWREKGVITPVKNQGECGSCWTFASSETLESHWAIKTGHLEDLSEQFILDCTPNPHQCGGTGGCDGGTAELAYDRLKQLGGLPSEWTYPYISGLGANQTCHGTPLSPQHPHSGSVMAAANVSGHVSLPSNQNDPLLKALATLGPLAVSVAAGDWHDYETGVYNGGNATNPELDHLVQLVGYGSDQGKLYWLVRNSWTPEWGENGYIRLARTGPGEDPPCGIDVNPLVGNGCTGGPPTVKVCGQSGVLFDGVYPLV